MVFGTINLNLIWVKAVVAKVSDVVARPLLIFFFSVIIFGCTSGGCTYSKAAGPYETKSKFSLYLPFALYFFYIRYTLQKRNREFRLKLFFKDLTNENQLQNHLMVSGIKQKFRSFGSFITNCSP